MSKEPVAVLGCGPAGLLSAHACALMEQPFAIFSRKAKSKLGGAQFLHSSIPGITSDEPEVEIRYATTGSAEEYRKKVYGTTDVPFVSFPDHPHVQPAWGLREAYEKLWDLYGEHVTEAEADESLVMDLLTEGFGTVFSTVPLNAICYDPRHQFSVQRISIQSGEYVSLPDNTIMYNGDPNQSWYRSSKIFGVQYTEWSLNAKLPPSGTFFQDAKPVKSDCDCWAGDDVVRLGRRGQWTKGVLVDHAFNEAVTYLMEIDR